MLRPTEEFPEFVAGLSLLTGLTPEDAREQLEARARAMVDELADVESSLRRYRKELGKLGSADIVRALLLEEEYRQTTLSAEVAWLERVVRDLRVGRLAWDDQRLRDFAAAFEASHRQDS